MQTQPRMVLLDSFQIKVLSSFARLTKQLQKKRLKQVRKDKPKEADKPKDGEQKRTRRDKDKDPVGFMIEFMEKVHGALQKKESERPGWLFTTGTTSNKRYVVWCHHPCRKFGFHVCKVAYYGSVMANFKCLIERVEFEPRNKLTKDGRTVTVYRANLVLKAGIHTLKYHQMQEAINKLATELRAANHEVYFAKWVEANNLRADYRSSCVKEWVDVFETHKAEIFPKRRIRKRSAA